MTATKEEVIAFMKSEFPQSKCVVEAVSDGGATVSHHVGVLGIFPSKVT